MFLLVGMVIAIDIADFYNDIKDMKNKNEQIEKNNKKK
jgi:hypothetical protein